MNARQRRKYYRAVLRGDIEPRSPFVDQGDGTWRYRPTWVTRVTPSYTDRAIDRMVDALCGTGRSKGGAS